MPAAFKCWNDSGITQIDSQYPNLRLVSKGSVYCATRFPNEVRDSSFYGDIPISASAPVVAFRCTRPCCSATINGNTHRFVVGRYANEPAAVQAYVDYWVFAISPAPLTVGMKVYAEDGTLVWTSKDVPAKVLGNFQTPPAFYDQFQTDQQVLAANYLAVVQTGNSTGVNGLGGPTGKLWTQTRGFFAQMLSGNTVRLMMTDVSVVNQPWNFGHLYPSFNSYLYLDVAGQ